MDLLSQLAILAAFQRTAFPPAKPVVQVVESKPASIPVPIKSTAPPKAVFVPPKNTGDILDRIAMCESHMNPRAVNPTGKYRGAFQFDLATYHANGGSGDPIDASYAEQKRVAQNLYSRRGGSPWPVCSKR